VLRQPVETTTDSGHIVAWHRSAANLLTKDKARRIT
jgi:hypothetical protein